MKAYELDNTKASSLGTYLPNILDLETDETILYMVVTTDYSGFMVFAYDNGKIARVPLSSYETKTNRKRLVKAYSDFAPLVNLFFFNEETDLIFSRYTAPDEIRLVLANTELISEKTTKNTKGIQVIRLKKGSIMNIAELASDVELNSIEQYRIDKVPMSGTNVDIVDRLMIQTYMK